MASVLGGVGAGVAGAAQATREVAGMIGRVRVLSEKLQAAVMRTSEMRARLLGLRDPEQLKPGRSIDVPAPNQAELDELGRIVGSMQDTIETLHSHLGDLERV